MATEKKNVFVIDDGTVEYSIENNFGQEICKLHISSGDIGIIDRFEKFTGDFDDIVEPLKEVDMKNDGTPEADEKFDNSWKVIKAVEKELIDRINAVFDMQDAGKLFETRHAFSSVNGKFYIESVIDMLSKIVTAAIEEEGKKTESRLKKYTSDLKREKK